MQKGSEKRSQVLDMMHSLTAAVVFLQETHFRADSYHINDSQGHTNATTTEIRSNFEHF